MHDLVVGLSFLVMLILPSVVALRSGVLTSPEEQHASVPALSDN